MNNNYDVIVIGGGYFGSSISFHLSQAGYRTLLLEQKELASGSSGANYGCIQVQDSNMGISMERTLRGFKGAMKLELTLGCNLDLKVMGSLIVAENDAEIIELEKLYQEKKEYGLPVELLNPKDIKKIEPYINEKILRGASYMTQGRLTPWKLVYGFVNKGKELGLEVREWSKVVDYIRIGDTIKGVVLENGERIEARHVIITAGAHSKKLGNLAGINIPVEYIKGEAFVTERVKPMMNNFLSSAAFFTDAHGDSSNCALAMMQSNEGNFLIGETGSIGPEDPDDLKFFPSRTHLSKMAGLGVRFYPVLRDLKILRTFSVASPYTKDMEPIFGKTNLDGLYVAAGFKSCVVITTAIGEEMTEIIRKQDN
ncbi:MAG: FAD dependent oxidoreductase [Fusobacteria bacterium]|nr:MAG: FAD dependent oxidoreductase [Fusobacteriota bacterium]KAF0228490.1 MAG: FAD dependent [Fusobacteriota bacterium]